MSGSFRLPTSLCLRSKIGLCICHAQDFTLVVPGSREAARHRTHYQLVPRAALCVIGARLAHALVELGYEFELVLNEGELLMILNVEFVLGEAVEYLEELVGWN